MFPVDTIYNNCYILYSQLFAVQYVYLQIPNGVTKLIFGLVTTRLYACSKTIVSHDLQKGTLFCIIYLFGRTTACLTDVLAFFNYLGHCYLVQVYSTDIFFFLLACFMSVCNICKYCLSKFYYLRVLRTKQAGLGLTMNYR